MKLFFSGFFVCILATFSPLAFGQLGLNTTWTGADANGSWVDGGNWTFGVPTTANSAFINVPVNINLPTGTTTSGDFHVESTVGLFIPAGGVLSANSTNVSTFIGDGIGSGILTLTGPGTLAFPGTEGTAVGVGGPGTVTQSGTSIVTVTSGLFIGGDGNVSTPSSLPFDSQIALGGTGVYNLTGASQLLADPAVGSINVGSGSGLGAGAGTGGSTPTTGILNISSSSANAVTANNFNIGLGANGNGAPAAVINTTGTVSQSSGVVTITTATSLGTDAGAVGNYGISGGSLTSTSIFVGAAARGVGTFTQTGGTVTAPTLLSVGESGTGSYSLQAGAVAVNDGGALTIGNQTGGVGTFTQTGGTVTLGTGLIATPLTVGNAGTGTYNFNGGTINSNTISGITVGGGAGIGIFNLNGGVFTNPGTITIGAGTGSGVFNFNSGSLTGITVAVGGTGTFNQNTTFSPTVLNPITVASGGTYQISGGTLTVSGDTSVAGSSGIDASAGGAATTAKFNFNGGTVVSSGAFWNDTLNGTITNNANTGISTTITSTAADPVNLSGSLSGSGVLNISNGSGVNITGTNNTAGSAWGAVINSGTLVASVTNLSSVGTFSIASGATLQINPSAAALAAVGPSTDTFLGTIAGTGSASFNIGATNPATNTIEIANANLPATTTTTIGAGALQVDNGIISNINATAASTSTAVPSLVIGNGTAVGTVQLLFNGALPGSAGFNTFANVLVNPNATLQTGALLVNNNLTNNGSISAATVTVANTLVNSGSLTATTSVTAVAGLTNNGPLISPNIISNVVNASTIYTQTITGNLTNNGQLGSNAPLTTTFGATTLTISGNLTSTASPAESYVIRDSGSNADKFVITGATALAPATIGGSFIVTGAGGIGTGFGGKAGTNTYTVIQTNAPGALTLSGPIVQPPSSLLLSANVALNAASDDIILTTVQSPLAAYAKTQNQLRVAQAVDRVGSTAIISVLGRTTNPLTANQIADGLQQLTPENLEYSRNIAFENSTYLVQNVNDVLANMRSGWSGLDTSGVNLIAPGFGSSLGRTMGSLLAQNAPSPSFHNSAPNGVNYYPDEGASPSSIGSAPNQTISDSPVPLQTDATSAAKKAPAFSEFVGGDVILADLNQSLNSTSKAKYTAGDANAGIAFRVTSHLSAGILFDYNHTTATTDAWNSRTQVSTYSPGVFGTFFEKNFYVNGLFTFGLNNYINTRNIPTFATTASSNPHGQQYVGDLDTGYDFHPFKDWTVGPTLGATYTHLDIDPFTETGAAVATDDFSVNRQSAQSLRSRLGGHLAYATKVGSLLLQPNVSVMWQHEYLDQGAGLTASANEFGSGAINFTTNSLNDKDSALVGCGLNATLDNSMGLYFNYFADAGNSDFFSQSVIAGFKAAF